MLPCVCKITPKLKVNRFSFRPFLQFVRRALERVVLNYVYCVLLLWAKGGQVRDRQEADSSIKGRARGHWQNIREMKVNPRAAFMKVKFSVIFSYHSGSQKSKKKNTHRCNTPVSEKNCFF